MMRFRDRCDVGEGSERKLRCGRVTNNDTSWDEASLESQHVGLVTVQLRQATWGFPMPSGVKNLSRRDSDSVPQAEDTGKGLLCCIGSRRQLEKRIWRHYLTGRGWRTKLMQNVDQSAHGRLRHATNSNEKAWHSGGLVW